MKPVWKKTKLGASFATVTGNTPPKNNPDFFGEFIPLVKPPELRDATLETAEDGLSELGSKVARIAPPHSILVSCIGNLGKIGLNTIPLAFNQQINAILPDENTAVPEFLFYQVLSCGFKEQLEALASGTTVPIVNKSRFNSIEIVLPPLAEQRRIVGLLDAAFAGLATAKANAEKNLQNARALFESHLQLIFEEAWRTSELVTLADLATDITDGDHLPPPKSAAGVPFITIGNVVKQTRQIDFRDTFTVPRAYYEALKPHKKPQHGDVLYTVTGSFGIPVVVPKGVEFCFQRHIGLVRPRPDTNSSWLYYLLLSPQLLKQANDSATGAAQRTVSLKALRKFEVPKVPPKQQKESVARLDALQDKSQRLAALYARKLAALETLKKSLLHQAFSGCL